MDKVLVIYDSKAEGFLPPFVRRSRGEAIREFGDHCGDPKSPFNRHPADFTLFEIGEYDERKGAVTMHEAKVSLANAVEYANKTEPMAPAQVREMKSLQGG